MARQLFYLVLNHRSLTKVENSASTYEGEFLVPANNIDWISQLRDLIQAGKHIYGEWGHPKRGDLKDKDFIDRCRTIDLSNRAIIIMGLEVINTQTVRLMFSVTENTLKHMQDTKTPFVLALRHLANLNPDNSIRKVVEIIALDLTQAETLHSPIPNWILKQLHPEFTLAENTMENPNQIQELETTTLATGQTTTLNDFDAEKEFDKIKDSTEIQFQEADFNQPNVDGMILEEQEYGVKVIKISPVINNGKEKLTDVLDVMAINAAAGNTPSIITEAEKDIVRQTKIDLGECLELLDAVVIGDTIELQDALSDKRVTLNGFATFLPISLSNNFAVTRDMLFTRFDTELHNAVRTQEKYSAIGVKTYITESLVNGKSYYANKVAEDVTGDDGEFYPRDKFLKSINYKKENFQPIDGLFNPKDTNAITGRWNVIRSMLENFIGQTDAKVAELCGADLKETN